MRIGWVCVVICFAALAKAATIDHSALTAHALGNSDFAVDLVYTWVNGSDKQWQQQRSRDQAGKDRTITAGDADTAHRFQDHDELKFSLRSVFDNAKWVRNIFIVTCCGQRPAWLKEDGRVQVIDHKEIIPQDLYSPPTYNSFAIETWVHRIPGLAEQFVLMNDDFFFGAPTQKSDLFDEHGRPKISFQEDWGYTRAPEPQKDQAYLWASYNCDILLNMKFNEEKRYKVLHQAYPTTKSLFLAAHDNFGEQLNTTTSHKFRARTDVVPLFLADWIGIYTGKAMRMSSSQYPRNTYIKLQDDKADNRQKLLDLLAHSGEYKFFCIGDHTGGQSSSVDMLDDFFNAYFPTKAPCEK